MLPRCQACRVGTWNIAGARREQTNQVDLDAVVAGVRALGVDLLAVQEVDRMLARSGRADQPAVIAQAMCRLVLVLCAGAGRGRLPAAVRPRPGRPGLRQPAGVAAVPGGGRAPAVPPGRRG
jgi:hypothetical protein